eukprot:6173092-Pleurochrysis_carterae.AAC.2
MHGAVTTTHGWVCRSCRVQPQRPRVGGEGSCSAASAEAGESCDREGATKRRSWLEGAAEAPLRAQSKRCARLRGRASIRTYTASGAGGQDRRWLSGRLHRPVKKSGIQMATATSTRPGTGPGGADPKL